MKKTHIYQNVKENIATMSYCQHTVSEPIVTCSKLAIKTAESHGSRISVFTNNFEHISHIVLVFLLITLNK